MRVVLFISMGSLSSHHFASSGFDDLSASSMISPLIGDVMAAAWVHKDANWDEFLSSHLIPLISLGRNALETIFSFY
jgi:hypothetical protein